MFQNGATFNKEFEIASEFNSYFASVYWQSYVTTSW